MKHPIDSIQWLPVDSLTANDYNPNHVFKDEMRLLELSLLKNGWIQPVLVTADRVVIDGFHRSTLARVSEKVRALSVESHGRPGLIPCAVLDLTEAERMLLTVRINRAKGAHTALKMSELIKRLHVDLGIEQEYIARSIGADLDEIRLLLQENVFEALKVTETDYSRAWVPK